MKDTTWNQILGLRDWERLPEDSDTVGDALARVVEVERNEDGEVVLKDPTASIPRKFATGSDGWIQFSVGGIQLEGILAYYDGDSAIFEIAESDGGE